MAAQSASSTIHGEKEALQKLPEGNWKLLCDGKRCAEDGAEMKESMMLPAKSMVLLARE